MKFLLRLIVVVCGLILILLSLLLSFATRPATALMMASQKGTLNIQAVMLENEQRLPIAQDENPTRYFSWSPDGKWILYSAWSNGTQNLYRKHANGHRQELLENLTDYTQFYGWSPDQKWVIFYAIIPSMDKVFYLMRPDGSQQTRLSHLPNLEEILAWSGQWVILSTINRGREALYRVYLFENRTEYLAGNLTPGSFKALSKNGDWLVYSFYHDDTHKLHRLDIANREVVPLLPDSQFDRFHTVDGNFLVFSDHDDKLYRLDMTTGKVHFLYRFLDCPYLDFQGVSNGDMLFWCGYEDLYKVSLESGKANLVIHLADNRTQHNFAGWNGNCVWFSAYKDDVRSLFVLDLSRQQFNRLTNGGKSEAFISWTPDNKWGIVSEFRAASQNNKQFALYRISPDGKTQTRLTNNQLFFYGWSPPLDATYPTHTMLVLVFILLSGQFLQRPRDH